MIVKIIPETEKEKESYANKGFEEIEHKGVRDFMFFGNRVDEDGELHDVHEWHGSYMYLMGGLDYFYKTVDEHRQAQGVYQSPSLKLAKSPSMVKRGEIAPDIQTLDLSKIDLEKEFKGVSKIPQTEEDLEEAIADLMEEEVEIKPQGLKLI